MPHPYREKIHERVSERLHGDYHVIYCVKREPDRAWDISLGAYSKSLLRKSFFAHKGKYYTKYIHVNFDVWPALNRLDPRIVITTGFNPTFIFAFVWCLVKGRKHIPYTEGWLKSEESLSAIHFLVRRLVFSLSNAFIAASPNTRELFRHYGCPEASIFLSHMCADNDYYKRFAGSEKKYDIIFSGQFIHRKMPFFFAEVVKLLKVRKPDLRVLLLGDGPDRGAFLDAVQKSGVEFDYAGYVSQRDLPAHYASARILLFPTREDTWGLVANEACAVGVPVVTCPNAGAANNLVIDGYNGFVLDLDAETWCEHVWKLLDDRTQWEVFSRNALKKVQEYNYDSAAEGIIQAVEYCAV